LSGPLEFVTLLGVGSARRAAPRKGENVMQERYPYIRFVVGMSQQLASAIAVIVLFGGTLRSCEVGGFSGFVSFVLTVFVAGVAYVSTMVSVESLRVFLDIEESTRQILAAVRKDDGPVSGDR
jgi:hypothetical protein